MSLSHPHKTMLFMSGPLSAFTDMIFLTIGDVDIPAQIPTKFRTV